MKRQAQRDAGDENSKKRRKVTKRGGETEAGDDGRLAVGDCKTTSQLNRFTCDDLKAYLKSRRLPIAGTKAALVDLVFQDLGTFLL